MNRDRKMSKNELRGRPGKGWGVRVILGFQQAFFFRICELSLAKREIEFRRCTDASANYLLDYLCDAGAPVNEIMCLKA